MTIKGQKHLVSCRCVLSQFKSALNPPVHKFVVFSVLDDDVVRVKFVQCNNCGVLHKVTDICKSEILHGKEGLSSVTSIEDLKLSLNPQLVKLLEANFADIASYEAVQFAIENKMWGEFIVLSADTIEGTRQVKFVRILSETLYKIDTAIINEVI